jgi:hypothetical protein
MPSPTPTITDSHAHAFPDGLAARAIEKLEARQNDEEPGAFLDGTISSLLRSMDCAGIHRSIICSIATAPKQTGPILEWSARVRSPRIVPFASVHPASPHPAADVGRIAESPLRGVKLHPQYQDFDLADHSVWPIFEAIEQAGLILALHCGLDFAFPMDDERAHPQKVLALHQEFPDIPLVATHMGGWRQWETVLNTLAGTDLYFETSYSLDLIDPDLLQRIIRTHPIERILFGTDSPWQDQKMTLEKVRALFPDPGDQRKVLSDNAAELLGEHGNE